MYSGGGNNIYSTLYSKVIFHRVENVYCCVSLMLFQHNFVFLHRRHLADEK